MTKQKKHIRRSKKGKKFRAGKKKSSNKTKLFREYQVYDTIDKKWVTVNKDEYDEAPRRFKRSLFLTSRRDIELELRRRERQRSDQTKETR